MKKVLSLFLFLFTYCFCNAQSDVLLRVVFDSSSVEVNAKARDSILRWVIPIMKYSPSLMVRIDAYEGWNERKAIGALSEDRAQNIRNIMLAEGIDSGRIIINDWGNKSQTLKYGRDARRNQILRDSVSLVNRTAIIKILNFDYAPVASKTTNAAGQRNSRGYYMSQANRDSMKVALKLLRRYPALVVEINSYIVYDEATDYSDPKVSYAALLNKRRANLCREFFISAGIDSGRIITTVINTLVPTYQGQCRFGVFPMFYVNLNKPRVFCIGGWINDATTHKPLEGVTVHMLGSDGTDIPHQTDVFGYYQFFPYDFNDGVIYKMKAAMEGYIPSLQTDSIVTSNMKESNRFVVNFMLKKK